MDPTSTLTRNVEQFLKPVPSKYIIIGFDIDLKPLTNDSNVKFAIDKFNNNFFPINEIKQFTDLVDKPNESTNLRLLYVNSAEPCDMVSKNHTRSVHELFCSNNIDDSNGFILECAPEMLLSLNHVLNLINELARNSLSLMETYDLMNLCVFRYLPEIETFYCRFSKNPLASGSCTDLWNMPIPINYLRVGFSCTEQLFPTNFNGYNEINVAIQYLNKFLSNTFDYSQTITEASENYIGEGREFQMNLSEPIQEIKDNITQSDYTDCSSVKFVCATYDTSIRPLPNIPQTHLVNYGPLKIFINDKFSSTKRVLQLPNPLASYIAFELAPGNTLTMKNLYIWLQLLTRSALCKQFDPLYLYRIEYFAHDNLMHFSIDTDSN
jgi:hypothetical protein